MANTGPECRLPDSQTRATSPADHHPFSSGNVHVCAHSHRGRSSTITAALPCPVTKAWTLKWEPSSRQLRGHINSAASAALPRGAVSCVFTQGRGWHILKDHYPLLPWLGPANCALDNYPVGTRSCYTSILNTKIRLRCRFPRKHFL